MKTKTPQKFYCLLLFFIVASRHSTAQFNLSLTEVSPITCHGQQDAIIFCQATPLASYSYYLNGHTTPTTNGYFYMLSPGTHTVCATDGIGISICETIDINSPEPLDIVFNADSLVSCHGNDGSISIDILGGTAINSPYHTQWTDANSNSVSDSQTNLYSTSMNGLASGQYNVLVEDDHGCIYSEAYILQSAVPLTVSTTYTPTICYDENTLVTLQSNGGVNYAPINYFINGDPALSIYGAGFYTVIASDAKGCSASTTFQINEYPNDSISINISSCNTYLWHGVNYVSSGSYIHTHLNGNGCTSKETLLLSIHENTYSTYTVSVCRANGLYQWFNGDIENSGIYTHTLYGANTQGCDSIITLNLTYYDGIRIAARAMLYGAFDATTGLMKDSLRRVTHRLAENTAPSQGQSEVGAPVNVIPMIRSRLSTEYLCANDDDTIMANGNVNVAQNILSVSGANAIVDWIMLEIRSGTDSNIILATKNALLQRDGDIVSCDDGISPLEFSCLCPNELYYISVRHRNHLGVMTMHKIVLTDTEATAIDFSNTNTAIWVNPDITNAAPRKLLAGKALLWGCDANNNKATKYNGLGNDKEFILNDVGGPGNSNNVVYHVYKKADTNMDGKIRYQGIDNDRAFLLNMITTGSQTNTTNGVIAQHTPN